MGNNIVKPSDTIKPRRYYIKNLVKLKVISHSEMRPVLVRRASFREKLRGLKDVYKTVPHGFGMSGTDPLGSFIVSSIALSPVAKIFKPAAKLFKSGSAPKYTKTLTGIDGKSYKVVSTVTLDNLDLYIADGMIYEPKTITSS